MKRLIRYLTVAVAASFLAVSAYAGECCTKSADKAKAGKTCVECAKHACCKEAIKKLGDEAKTCAKCAAKKSEKKT